MKSCMVNGHFSVIFEPMYLFLSKKNSVEVMFILTVSWTSLPIFSRTFDNQQCPLPFSLTNLSKFYWTNNTCSYPRESSLHGGEQSSDQLKQHRWMSDDYIDTVRTTKNDEISSGLGWKSDLSHKRAWKISISSE